MQHAAPSVAIAPGSEVLFNSHVISVAPMGISSSVTRAHQTNIQPPTVVKSVAGDHDDATTDHRQSSVVVVADETQTLTAQLGSAVTISSHGVDVATDGNESVVKSSMIDRPTNDGYEEGASTAVWTSDGSTFTAIVQGPSVPLRLPTATATSTVHAMTTIAGEKFGVSVSNNFIEHGSSTLTLLPVNGGSPGDPGEATTLFQNGQKLVASVDSDKIIIQQGKSGATLTAGQDTTFNGHLFGVAQSGSDLIVDGSVITLLPTGPPAAYSKKADTASQSGSGFC